MVALKVLMMFSLALFQLSAFANPEVALKLVTGYLNAAERSLQGAKSLSANQAIHIATTANRAAVARVVNTYPQFLVKQLLGFETQSRAEAFKLIQENRRLFMDGLENSIAGAHKNIEYYRLYTHLQNNTKHVINTVDPKLLSQLSQAQHAEMLTIGRYIQLNQVEVIIDSFRRHMGQPAFDTANMLTPAAGSINVANDKLARKVGGAAKYVGPQYIDNLLKAAIKAL